MDEPTAGQGQISLDRAQVSIGLNKCAAVAAKDRTLVQPLYPIKAVVQGHSPSDDPIVSDDEPAAGTARRPSRGPHVWFTQTLAASLASARITANCLSAGFVPTSLARDSPRHLTRCLGADRRLLLQVPPRRDRRAGRRPGGCPPVLASQL